MASRRRLLVIRHAKSNQDVGGADHDRPLNARGRRDAGALGRHLSGEPAIDLVLCSSAVRARQTWELAAPHLDAEPRVIVNAALYAASPDAVLAQVRDVPDDVRSLVVVGHEPTQSTLVSRLSGAGDDPGALESLEQNGFVTCGIAVLESEASWPDLADGICSLRAFTVPRG